MAEKVGSPVDEIERTSSLQDAPEELENKKHAEEDWTPEEERKLVRKIDWRILPYLSIVFALSLLDRANISAAYIAGMSKDLKLTIENRYSIALLLFFITYAIFEIPSNLVIRRLGARWWLAFLITCWGVCVLAMGFVDSWVSLTVLRMLLGVFEAGYEVFPGAIFIISAWYKTYETARRVSLFYMSAIFAAGFNGIIAYLLSLIRAGDGKYREGWRWIFLIEGAITVACGLIAPWCLGEFPEKSGWLTDRQRHIATTRLMNERSGREYEHPNLRQGLRMLMDWKVGIYALQYFIAASSGYSLAYFMPIILRQGMGFSYALAQILSSPPYLFTVIMSLVSAWLSDKMKLRWPFLCGHAVFAIVGLLIVLYAKPPGVRLFGTFFAIFGTQANIPATLAYGQNQTALPQKKGLVAAAMITVGAAGGITGSTIFAAKDAPMYLPGMWATIGFQFLYIAGTSSLSLWFTKKNREADETGIVLEGVEGFRYAP